MIAQYSIQTPTLLFPALTLLLLAYTNRFLGITQVIRKLHADLLQDKDNKDFYLSQIHSLNGRINLIIAAQKSGILSLMLCIVSMFLLMADPNISFICFCFAMACLLASLVFIFRELTLSKDALTYILEDCKKASSTVQ